MTDVWSGLRFVVRLRDSLPGRLGPVTPMAAGTAPEPRAFRLGSGDPDGPRRVRDVLESHGYRDAEIVELLGVSELTRPGRRRLPALLRRTGGGSPLETLARLFLLGVAVDAEAAARAFAPMSVADWGALGLVEVSGGSLRATVQLRRYQELVVAFDFTHDAVLPFDYVMGISPSSLTLAGLTVRRPNAAALELGTGSGFQALLAAAHSERVLATDRNPRAVEMAAFNARLNGLDNVVSIQGDLFDPVDDGPFDLIVSNPPFIVAPHAEHLFLHSGLEGDEVCRRIVRTAPRFLAAGGWCQLLANWAVIAGEDWRGRVRSWAEGTGCDVLVLRRGVQPVDEYAVTWLEGQDESPESLARAFARWMDYYDAAGIEAVASGLISLRRRSRGSPWFRADDAPESMSFPCGDDVAAAFDRADRLADLSDDRALMGSRLVLAPDVRLHQHSRPGTGGWEVVAAELRRSEGLQYAGNIDEHGAALLVRCDGQRTLGELVADLATSLGTDAEVVAPAVVGVVRRLVEQGFLSPA